MKTVLSYPQVLKYSLVLPLPDFLILYLNLANIATFLICYDLYRLGNMAFFRRDYLILNNVKGKY